MPYAEPDSALLGGIPVHNPDVLNSFFVDAAEEIDSSIGTVYEIPVTKAADGSALSPVTTLILKRINRYLASGRYILSVASAGEDDGLHAYGLSLVREAQASIAAIATGTLDFDAKRVATTTSDNRKTPAILNAEARSNVDAFYGGNGVGSDGMLYSGRTPWAVGRLEVERGW